jgi:hypothetical protein
MSVSKVAASRSVRIIATMATAFGFTFAAGPLTASADPGFCGVRSSGPTMSGIDDTYGVRNKCGTAYNWKVYLPSVGRYATGSNSLATCQVVPAYSTSFWYAPTADPNWYVQNC